MSATPVIAVFDVGKTNKKLFLLDEHYKIVWERTARFSESVDEDGFPCENLQNLKLSVFDALRELAGQTQFEIKAINFSTYGASFVLIGKDGSPVAPLYNYLKPYPEELKKQFYDQFGGEEEFSFRTASPVLGSLNSGMQLYRIKQEKPHLFRMVQYALHLPQYMSYLLTGKCFSDLTSLGCHTGLWDFQKNEYHEWVRIEGITSKLAPIMPSDHVELSTFRRKNYPIGIGLHDSSAALIPYLVSFQEPFVLISTGTWCISLNPFNPAPLTRGELQNDCLYNLTYEGKPVKASRLFAGNEHEEQTARIAEHFGLNGGWYRTIEFDHELVVNLQNKNNRAREQEERSTLKRSLFVKRDLNNFTTPGEAYHQLMMDLVQEQYASTQLVVKETPVKRIFVDGGFSNNQIFMNLLAAAFPNMEVYAASVAQATATGAALAIHQHWNKRALPGDIIELKYYSLTHDPIL